MAAFTLGGFRGHVRAESGADLTALLATQLDPFATVYLEAKTASCPVYNELDQDCVEIADGCLEENVETHVLRFDATTRNDGNLATAVAQEPEPPPPGATPDSCPFACDDEEGISSCSWSNCDPVHVWSWSHHHYHLRDYGVYTLIDATTKAFMGTGTKFSFLWPGLFPGEIDTYSAGIACQFIKVDGFPDGAYNLVQQVNTLGTVPEGRPFNNATAIRLQISGDLTAVTTQPSEWDSTETTIVSATGATTAVSVISRHVNTYDFFYVGPDGKLYLKSQGTNGQWTPSSNGMALTGSTYTFVGSPAAITRHSGEMTVFARDDGGSLRRLSWNGTSWSLNLVVGQAAGPPAAAAASRTRALAGWISSNGQFRYSYMNSGFAWGSPTYVAGATFPSDQTPILVASGAETIHLFLRSSTGSVLYNRHDHTAGWGTWVDLGSSVIGSLSAASPRLNHIHVFARASDNKLIHNVSTDNGNSFAAWSNDDGVAGLDAFPTVVSGGVNTLDVFYYYRHPTPTSPTVRYRRRHFDGTSWLSEDVGTISTGGAAGIPMVVGSWANTVLDVFLALTDGTVLVRSRR